MIIFSQERETTAIMQKYFNQILLFAAQGLCFIALPWWTKMNYFPTNGEQHWLNLMLLSGFLGTFVIVITKEYLSSYIASIFVVGFAFKYYTTAQFPLLNWGLKTFKMSIENFRDENYQLLANHLWQSFNLPIKAILILFLLSSLILYICLHVFKFNSQNTKTSVTEALPK